MRIWFDVLTGKQLLFAEPMIKRLGAGNEILCTSRNYRELNRLVRIRGINTRMVGRHGGAEKISKLVCSAQRIERLSRLVHGFGPDLTVSFQSPEAARVAFGLGIRHIGFSDSPHASRVMRMTVPYLDKLLVPWVIKKEKFSRFGIAKKDIIPYRALDGALIAGRRYTRTGRPKRGKTIVVRPAEEQASYEFADTDIVPIIWKILEELPEFRVVVLPRYAEQIRRFRDEFGKKIRVMQEVHDSKDILRNADIFIGSGGTMTAEAPFLGIPTISFSRSSGFEIDVFLEKRRIVTRETDPAKFPGLVRRLERDGSTYKRRAMQLYRTMEDPFPILKKVMKA